jgi:3-oxoacyl-[acyl-carrier-protein] synthase II
MNLLSMYATAASRLALLDADLRVGPKNADTVGICMGVCNGPPESDHMNSVFAHPGFPADINNFANITANSTAGWASNALCLKGVNMTLASGPHAGLMSIAYAFNSLREDRAQAIIAAGADEVYPQMYYNYDLIGFLHRGEEEDRYACNFTHAKRKVIGEGAASLLVETLESAQKRNTPLLAEVLGYGMSMDAMEFSAPSLTVEGLRRACETALSRCGLDWQDIGCVVWAPQGNVQDEKVLSVLQSGLGEKFPRVPCVTTTFNTGYIETASIVAGLACTLESLKNGPVLWPQMTGVPTIDSRSLNAVPEYLLALATTDLGYNYAIIFRTGQFVHL